jgi:hypothetical protein
MKVRIPGLKDSDGEVFKSIPAGSYTVRIIKTEEKKTGERSKNPGSPGINIVVKVCDSEDYEDHMLSLFLMLPSENMDSGELDKCVAKIKRLMIACGLEDQIDDDDLDFDDLHDEKFKAIVTAKANPDNPNKFNNFIQDFMPLDD